LLERGKRGGLPHRCMDATLESEDAEEGYNQRPVTDRTGARDWRGRSAVLSGQAVSQEAGYRAERCAKRTSREPRSRLQSGSLC
jgi:IS5 family transposase